MCIGGSNDPIFFCCPQFAAANPGAWSKQIAIARLNAIRLQNDSLHHAQWLRGLGRIVLDIVLAGGGSILRSVPYKLLMLSTLPACYISLLLVYVQ